MKVAGNTIGEEREWLCRTTNTPSIDQISPAAVCLLAVIDVQERPSRVRPSMRRTDGFYMQVFDFDCQRCQVTE